MTTWYSYSEILLHLCRKLKPKRILEWGPGKSTSLMNNELPNAHIDSLEHDLKWFQDRSQLFKNIKSINIHHITGNDYISWPLNQEKYDLIFVDGRYRVRCMKIAEQCLSDNGVIVLHDAERHYYQPGIDYLVSKGFSVTGKYDTKVLTSPIKPRVEIKMKYRYGIVILSYKRPKYLKRTLDSLYQWIDKDRDKVLVYEQSDDGSQNECINICKEYSNLTIVPSDKNYGQRGAINRVQETGFFKDCEYVFYTDHDNEFHEDISVFAEKLDKEPEVWVATGYFVKDHDIENKKGEWTYQSTARAGHMVLRSKDFLSLFPMDEQLYVDQGCAWFAGFDWTVTHWHPNSPGYKRSQFVACLPGSVTTFGDESTWQGHYTHHNYTIEELKWIRLSNLYNIVKKFPPQHFHLKDKYWYETISDDEFKKICLSNNMTVTMDIQKSEKTDADILKELAKNSLGIDIDIPKHMKVPLKTEEDKNTSLTSNDPELVEKYKKIFENNTFEFPNPEELDKIITKKPPIETKLEKHHFKKEEASIIDSKSTIDSIEKPNITAFNYLWPKYNFNFLEESIKSVLPYIKKYILYLNKYSYMGEPCPQKNIDYILKICSKYDIVQVEYNTDSIFHPDCKNDNIRYYINKCYLNELEFKTDYIWLVQSDEIYKPKEAEQVVVLAEKQFDPVIYIFRPICYFNSPNWKVNPIENYTRATFIRCTEDVMDYYYHPIDGIHKALSEIYFDHLSYVLTDNDLHSKFINWGHRREISLEVIDDYRIFYDKTKTNKTSKNFHPIIPHLYHELEFIGDDFNNDLFIKWFKYLVSEFNDIPRSLYHFLDLCLSADDDHFNMPFSETDIKVILTMLKHFVSKDDNYLLINADRMLLSILMNDINSNSINIESNEFRYRLGLRNIFEFSPNLNLYFGDYKSVIPKITNNSISAVFIDSLTMYPMHFNNYIIELSPKLKANTPIFGWYYRDSEFKENILPNIIKDNIRVTCPWGDTIFGFYEVYYDIFNDDNDISYWFARMQ